MRDFSGVVGWSWRLAARVSLVVQPAGGTVVCESWMFVLFPSLHLPWHQAHVVLVALSGLANVNLALTLL